MAGRSEREPSEAGVDRSDRGEGMAPVGAPNATPVMRTRQGRVFALQRSHGNATVNHLLARQELGRPVQIDREDVLITPVSGPSLTAAGGYDWGVTYQLPFAAEADGFMIQELHMESSSATGGGTHFWECWRVRSGSRVPVDRGFGGFDDHYVFGNVPGAAQPSSGWKRHAGVIRFYPGPLPSQFGPDNSGQHFYHSLTQPAGWTGRGTRHDAYSQWDATRHPALNGFVGYAGSTEVRAGDTVTFRPRTTP